MKPVTMQYGIIGGSGFYRWASLESARERTIHTRWGSVTLLSGQLEGKRVHFIPRHGPKHNLPPHLLKYRANLAALAEAGAKRILATSAVGSMNPEMKPGDLVLLSDFIDFTKNRKTTYAEKNYVLHIDMSDPYCPQLREVAQRSAKDIKVDLHSGGTYVCTEGARFETPAEIRAYRLLGGDVVGMTGVPEVTLARELGLCYASIAVVTNWAAGVSRSPLSPSEVNKVFTTATGRLQALIRCILRDAPPRRTCSCRKAPSLGLLGNKR